MKKIVFGLLGIICIFGFTACNKNENREQTNNTENQQTSVVEETQEKVLYKKLDVNEGKTPFRDYPDEAKRQVEEKVKEAVVLSFGKDIKDIRVTSTNVSFDGEKTTSGEIKDNSKDDDIETADNEKIYFDVTFDIMLSKTADPITYSEGGYYDEGTNWIIGKNGAGTLVYDGNELSVDNFDIIS